MQPVVFCADCMWSKLDKDSAWKLNCHNPDVNRKDEWALSAPTGRAHGSECNTERKKVWFAPCGRQGKLFEGRAGQTNPHVPESRKE